MHAHLSFVVKIVYFFLPHYRAYLFAKQYEGSWEPFNVRDGKEVPMEDGSLTVATRKRPWWSSVLDVDVYAHDIVPAGRREHTGYIVPDPLCPDRRAFRTVRYLDRVQVSRQRIEVLDEDTLYVIPDEADNHPHILRRVKSQLGLN
jgi:hypothetical protein